MVQSLPLYTVESYTHSECMNVVKTSDLISLGNLKELEILKLSKQITCRDEVLSTVARSCQKLRYCTHCRIYGKKLVTTVL